ncbi:solute carrier family 40 member 1-like isoform X2 [Mizuhopecten yessoensis]|uniref:Solute carrier family 40 member n=1 Tax=Mizuhopecten yessoensis TaxID=6573 RepID=A0A210PGF2_MIZYE|nr:solute carrier family 40 member 1-like isoform X2 [Mizuhopecten yessoensis]OWF35570.1 Solute carrier family 40 member 1 [Mizuhopecten yessoensis]
MAKEKLEAKTRWFVYISHFLSAWGDRMWSFGVGIFLVQLEPVSLRLVAIYGFANGGSILLLGAIVGDWVDKTARLSAAKWTLVIQNMSVCLCSVLVYFVFQYHAEIKEVWPEQGLADLSYAVIIVISIIGNLASEGRKIAVERDWVVVICGQDKDLLASMTSFLRTIDLTTLILAPVVTGQIIAFTVIGYGALFIAAWNLVSVVIEYIFVLKVYEKVPALRAVKNKDRKAVDKGPSDKESPLMDEGEEQITVNEDLEAASSPPQQIKQTQNLDETSLKTEQAIKTLTPSDEPEDTNCSGNCASCLRKVFKSFIILYRGWSTYMKYNVAFAGLGLSMLYMTVLGFDNITTGYAISQGVSESILGFLMAAGAIVGILGTIVYPRMRKRIGLERTGLFGILSQILILTLCVAAVWAPGSPFDLLYDSRVPKGEIITSNQCENMSIIITNQTLNNSTGTNRTNLGYQVSSDFNLANQSAVCNGTEEGTSTGPGSYISISLLMGGIIGARFGLWIADLTITQLFLEAVVERERGIVNGVQSSLNQCADMIKFLMVIVAPDPEVFGILILISFAFICLGWLFYAKYSRSARGHLFHFEKVAACFDSKKALPVIDITKTETESIRSR